MIGIFLATYQVCVPGEGQGPAWKHRSKEQTVFVLAEKPEEVGAIVVENVTLQPGEIVEIVGQQPLNPGRKVFQVKKP